MFQTVFFVCHLFKKWLGLEIADNDLINHSLLSYTFMKTNQLDEPSQMTDRWAVNRRFFDQAHVLDSASPKRPKSLVGGPKN